MTKLTGETLNIEEENIKKIKELFPEVDTDGKIDFDKLKQLLGDYVEDADERYNFTWNGKGEALRISQTPSMGTLRPAPEESKKWNETENLYIEGDNLEVLKLLQKSYFNKVDVIYIDPPYNTGGDFVYKDNFKDNIKNYKKITGQVDSEGQHTTTNREYSGRYHTDWLNMMYPRLKLANNLLSDDGVILISINDREFDNLKKICDEIFSESNFVGAFLWTKTETPPSLSNKQRQTVEFILVYEKVKNNLKYFGSYLENSDQPLLNRGNNKVELRVPKGKSLFTFKKEGYIEAGNYERIILHDDIQIVNGVNKNDYSMTGEFKWTQNKLDEEINMGTEVVIKSNNLSPRFQRVDSDSYKAPNNFLNKELNKKVGVSTNEDANKTLENLDLKNMFDYPKPVDLIKYLIKMVTHVEKDSLVLDFFAGSSTTAHAVMDLNAEDNGNRRFIMVQLPEETEKKSEAYKAGYKNIAEIGKERIRRAGNQIRDELAEKYESASDEEQKEIKIPDELDIGFKTFKLDSSNIKEWNPGLYDDVQLAIEDSLTPYVEGRIEKDVVYEMILKMGLDLTYPVEEYEVNGNIIYSVGYGFLMISLADDLDLAIAEKMIDIKEEYQPEEFRVIFRDEGFKNDTDKTNVKETLRSAGLAEEAFITL